MCRFLGLPEGNHSTGARPELGQDLPILIGDSWPVLCAAPAHDNGTTAALGNARDDAARNHHLVRSPSHLSAGHPSRTPISVAVMG